MDSAKHPLMVWMEGQQPPLSQSRAAEILEVSEPYLSQVISGKKRLTLTRAAAWARLTGLPLESFVQAEPAQ